MYVEAGANGSLWARLGLRKEVLILTVSTLILLTTAIHLSVHASNDLRSW